MTERKLRVGVVLVCVGLCISKLSPAATNCEQSFTFFGFTKDSSFAPERGIFWIGEDVGGECYGSYLVQIWVSDQGLSSVTTPLNEYSKWDWLKQGIERFPQHRFEELRKNDGIWGSAVCPFSVEPPMPDSALVRQVREAVWIGDERTWTQDHGADGISVPAFHGVEAELAYCHNKGLYVAYEISKVCYFPSLNYVLIFTSQPMLASGLDTMHGFLIFRITK